jgi:hypothetical protein
MIVWHVTTRKKFERYLKSGAITPPVRAWPNIEDAARFSCSTARRIILRLRMDRPERLPGHKGRAVVSYQSVKIQGY